MADSDSGWPPSEWKWLPTEKCIPPMVRDVAGTAQLTCRRYRLSIPHDSDDVAHDVLVELLDPLPADPLPGDYYEFWILVRGKANKFAKRYVRRRPRMYLTGVADPVTPEPPDPDWLQRYIAALPTDRMRKVFHCRVVDGNTAEEACRILSLTRNVVASDLSKALDIIEEKFAPDHATE